jgi:GNAT superfamily N-acetyltransferase
LPNRRQVAAMIVSKVETNPPDFRDFAALHALLSTSFAYMEGRIDPPSSMTRLSLASLGHKVAAEDLFLVRHGATPIACLFGTPTPDAYYIGKLAVAAPQRGRGLARALVEAAATRARALGAPALELQTRVELVQNHAAFTAMGFTQTAATAHPGYDRPTSLTFRRAL